MNSRYRGNIGQTFHKWVLPPRTPGVLGMNDAGDPAALGSLGDTPGTLGRNDYADPAFDGCYATEAFWLRVPLTPAYVMPNPSSTNPPLLSDADISKSAEALEIEAAAIYAVSKVESGGKTGFDDQGRHKILFEAKWFHNFTYGRYDKSHPHLSQATLAGARKYYTLDQWTRLTEAFALDAEAALKAASWGKFQVMGFNHNGYDDVFAFCDAMFVSEAEHLRSFLAYCKDNKLIPYLKSKNWAKFAEGYNGPQYKDNKYDEKMQKAYAEYTKQNHTVKT